MTKVLILYYSSFGHMEAMARAAAKGVSEAGAEATVKRVPDLVLKTLRGSPVTSSTRKPKSPIRPNWPTTMASFSVSPPGSA